MYVQTSYRRNSYCNNEYAKRNVKPKTNSKSCNWENYEPKQILKLPIQKNPPKQQLVVTVNFRKIHGHCLVKKNIGQMLKIQLFYPTHKNMKKTTMKKRTVTIPFYTEATNKWT